MERVLGLGDRARSFCPHSGEQVRPRRRRRAAAPSAREERSARGAPPCTRCSSGARRTGGREPSAELARRHALAAGLDPDADRRRRRCWSRCAAGSAPPLRERIGAGATRVRAEVPILLGVGGTVLRGSIDLLVEREGAPPLVVDYKTDRLGGADPGRARRPLRDPAHDLRPRRRRGARRRPRSRSPTSSSSAPRSPVLTVLGADRDGGRPRAPRAARSPASAGGEFPVAPPERAQLGPLPRLPGPGPPLLGPAATGGGAGVGSARRRRRAAPPARRACSSFSPSPTASSSAAQ